MPMGGALAIKGIKGAMVMMHGSQGCSTYIRRHIATHYNEPVDIASSSLNEKETVYGGGKKLKHGIRNVIKLYNPSVIGVLTTCLAETIGEDIDGIIAHFLERQQIEDVDVITASTPGYGASQYIGYFHTVKRIVSYYVKEKLVTNKINVITTLLSPAEQRELKRILALFELDYTLIPDISETLDAPFNAEFYKIPKGGTDPNDIKKMGGARATIEIGAFVPDYASPGVWLETEFGVPLYRCPIPMGIKGTDQLISILKAITGSNTPEVIKIERGRLLDAMIDAHKHNGEGRACVYGDPEVTLGATQVCIENGIQTRIIATGSQARELEPLVLEQLPHQDRIEILDDTDFETIHSLVKKSDVNILIGTGEGKFIVEKEHIPLVRIGFPVHDHIGAQRKCYIGYEGTMRFLDEISNTLLDQKHAGYRKRTKEQFFSTEELMEAK